MKSKYLRNTKLEERMNLESDFGPKKIIHRQKIGYIKINSVNGQITFSVFKVNGGGIYFKKPNKHTDRIKPSNIIHLNVDNELFLEYSPQIKQHIDMLIRMFLDLSITDFTLAMHKLKESVKLKPPKMVKCEEKVTA